MDAAWQARLTALRAELARHPSLAIAFSGGVDSSVLLHAAHAVLGERAVGVVADSPSLPRRELDEARAVARAIGATLEVVATDEGQDPAYTANRGDRCYFCKAALFRAMERVCRARGIETMAFGEITDDWNDDRPGARAAREARVVAPLSAAGFGKEDVRRYAREVGLAVADKPASACLASRVPVGTPVTAQRLSRIERAEEQLLDLGFALRRVRDHGDRARVEVDEALLPRAQALHAEIAARLAAEGFREVQLAAYRAPGTRPVPIPGSGSSPTL